MADILKQKKLTMFEKRIGQKPEKSSSSVLVRHRNRSGVVHSVGTREGALDVRESRERGDKIVPKFSPEKQENAILALSRTKTLDSLDPSPNVIYLN